MILSSFGARYNVSFKNRVAGKLDSGGCAEQLKDRVASFPSLLPEGSASLAHFGTESAC